MREKGVGYAASNTQVKGGDKTPQAEADAINAELATMRTNIAQMQKARDADVRFAASAVALALVGVPVPVMREPALAVRTPGGWETWWRGDAAPVKWSAALPAVADRVAVEGGVAGRRVGRVLAVGRGRGVPGAGDRGAAGSGAAPSSSW